MKDQITIYPLHLHSPILEPSKDLLSSLGGRED